MNYDKMPVSVHAGSGWDGQIFLVIRKKSLIKTQEIERDFRNLHDGIEELFNLYGSADKSDVIKKIKEGLVLVYGEDRRCKGLGYLSEDIGEFLNKKNKVLYDYFKENNSLLFGLEE